MRADDGTCTCGAQDGHGGVWIGTLTYLYCVVAGMYGSVHHTNTYLGGLSRCAIYVYGRIPSPDWYCMDEHGVLWFVFQLLSPSSYFLPSPRCRRCCRRRLTESRLDSVPDRTAGGLSRTVCDLGKLFCVFRRSLAVYMLRLG